MTSWKPDFNPNLEIQYDLNVNESGYLEGVATRFRKVIAVVPALTGTSGEATLGVYNVQWSGGQYDIYMNTSDSIVQASRTYAVVIYGIQ